MNAIAKSAAVLVAAGTLVTATVTSGEARSGRWAAAGAGFVAGALIGAAVANAHGGYYYGPRYGYYGSSYAYVPSYYGYKAGSTYTYQYRYPRYYGSGAYSPRYDGH